MRTQYDAPAVGMMVDDLASQILRSHSAQTSLTVVGIRTRGEILADRIIKRLQQAGVGIERGVLDITLYRDDLSEIGPRAVVRPTHLQTDINNKPLLLIDDVLFTGRTVRAALNALADFGRPSAIRLAVLVDRGGRELPIHADYAALTENVPQAQQVKVKLTERDGVDGITIAPRKVGGVA